MGIHLERGCANSPAFFPAFSLLLVHFSLVRGPRPSSEAKRLVFHAQHGVKLHRRLS